MINRKGVIRKNLLQLKGMQLEELKKYYVELRKYEFENDVPLKGISIRKKIHYALLSIVKVDRILSKEKIEIISDKRTFTTRPIIYACTHIGGNDIQRTFEAIKEHAYLFLGDPEGIYKDMTGLLLYLNGVICLETNDKNDRKIAKERAIELLKKGGNLLIYPEGAWNVTDNLPVMKLYTGAVKMALETDADIVPVAIEQYNDQFYINIGKNICVSDMPSIEINELNNILRNLLATLKWEIFESQGIKNRSSIAKEFIETFKQNIVDKCEYGFTLDDVYRTMFKDLNEPLPQEAFSYLVRLQPRKENAFLMKSVMNYRSNK